MGRVGFEPTFSEEEGFTEKNLKIPTASKKY